MKRSLEVFRAIDERHGGFDLVFFSKFAEMYLVVNSRSSEKQADVKQVVGLKVSGGAQPELLIADSITVSSGAI